MSHSIQLLLVREVLGHLVVARTAGDGDGNQGARVLFSEEWGEGFQQERLEPGGGVRNVGVHAQVADHLYNLVVEVERAAEISLRAGMRNVT